jgi:hypothetical protein
LSLVAGHGRTGSGAAAHNPDLVTALKDNRHQPGRRSHYTRAMLVVLQTAFSMALLIGSDCRAKHAEAQCRDIGSIQRIGDHRNLEASRFAALNQSGGASRITVSESQSVKASSRRARHRAGIVAPFGCQQGMDISVPSQATPVIPPFGGRSTSR